MKKLLVLFALLNVALGVAYGFTAGPYLEAEGGEVSARNLVSSGSESGFLVTTALVSFIASALAAAASIVNRIKLSTLVAVYVANSIVYGALLYLVDLDSSLAQSVRLGDWQLLLGIFFPVVFLLVTLVMHFLSGRRGNEA